MTTEQIRETFKKLFGGCDPSPAQVDYAMAILRGVDGHFIHSWQPRSGRTSIQLAIAVAYAQESGKKTVIVGHNSGHTEDLQEIVIGAFGDEIPPNLLFMSMSTAGQIRKSYSTFYDHLCYEAEEMRLRSKTAFVWPEKLEVPKPYPPPGN